MKKIFHLTEYKITEVLLKKHYTTLGISCMIHAFTNSVKATFFDADYPELLVCKMLAG